MGRRFRRMGQQVIKVVRKMFLKCCCCGRFTGQYKVETISLQKILSRGFCCSNRTDITECEECSDREHSSPEIIHSAHPDVTVLSTDNSSQGEQPLLVEYAAADFCHDVYPNGWNIKKTLSRGEFGKTELVTFPNYEGKYVLKTCDYEKSEHNLSMLLKCQSDFVRKVYACFSMNNERYMILDHCPSGNLTNLTKHGNVVDEDKAVWTIANLYTAAAHIHSLGMFNLNIKPSSVLINKTGIPVLSDFGNARRDTDKDDTGLLTQTSAYTCPEVLGGKQPSRMTDFWAIACCCYQLLKGKPPFLGKTTAETQTKICLGLNVNMYGLSLAASHYFAAEFNTYPSRRLGSRGISTIMTHSLFKGVDWEYIKSGSRFEKSPLMDVISSLQNNRSSLTSLHLPLSDSDSNCGDESSRRLESRRQHRVNRCRRKANSLYRVAVIDDGYLADTDDILDDG